VYTMNEDRTHGVRVGGGFVFLSRLREAALCMEHFSLPAYFLFCLFFVCFLSASTLRASQDQQRNEMKHILYGDLLGKCRDHARRTLPPPPSAAPQLSFVRSNAGSHHARGRPSSPATARWLI
jgi:hypothetical protein